MSQPKLYSTRITLEILSDFPVTSESLFALLHACNGKGMVSNERSRECQAISRDQMKTLLLEAGSDPSLFGLDQEQAEAQMALSPVDSFKGDFAWLSNMHPCPCPYEGKVFASSEHLYQWLKTAPGWWRDKIFAAPHGKVAKALAANPKCPKATHLEWDSFRLSCMETALRSKFENNIDLMAQLIGLGPREIIEGNTWNDRFWGVCKGAGENHLGRMLMRLRMEFIEKLETA